METRVITSQEADEVLRDWERRSFRVCFAVVMGDLAWHAHWAGLLHNAGPGRWILNSGQTTNMLSTDQYQQITLTEDDELVGIRFQQANGALAGFEVDIFVDKHDGSDETFVPFIKKIIQ